MKILVCGGSGVGKTSICSRLSGLVVPLDHNPTRGYNVHHFYVLQNNVVVDLYIYDVGIISLDDPIIESICDVDAAVIVVDSTNINSLRDADHWNERVDFYAPRTPKILAVNKADCVEKVVQSDALDEFVRAANFLEWGYTVGHPDLGDFDYIRGDFYMQTTPEDLVCKLLRISGVLMSTCACQPLWESIYFNSRKHVDASLMNLTSLDIYLLRQIELKEAVTASTQSSLQTLEDSGFKYFGGVMDRKKAVEIIFTLPINSFFLRISNISGELRVVVKKDSVLHYWVDYSMGLFTIKSSTFDAVPCYSLQDIIKTLGLDTAMGVEFGG